MRLMPRLRGRRYREISMVPVDPFEKAADCERSLQKSQEPERRLVLSKLRDLWIEVGNQRGAMTDEELASDIERLGHIQSELTRFRSK